MDNEKCCGKDCHKMLCWGLSVSILGLLFGILISKRGKSKKKKA